MINVRGIANSLIQQVNPDRVATLEVNDGYIIDDYGNQIPKFVESEIKIQTQSLSSREKDHLDLINRQGEFLSAYAEGSIHAIQRWENKGSSRVIVAPYGGGDPVIWQVDQVLESYSTWVRLLLVRQT